MTSQLPSSRLRKPTMRGGKPRPNSSTRIPAHFAVIKWPNSCTSTSRPNTGIAASQNQFIDFLGAQTHSLQGIGRSTLLLSRKYNHHCGGEWYNCDDQCLAPSDHSS